MGAWEVLFSLLILFTAALVLGTLAEELKQSSMIGYLLAGMLVGPHVLGWVGSSGEVDVIAELGVALLMFSIGIEFSMKRLIRLGRVSLVGGTLQVVLTTAVTAALARWMGMGWEAAIAVGTMISMTSTAGMVRSLTDTASIDTVWGRGSIAISLLQDIAMVPIVLLIAALGGKGSATDSAIVLGHAVVFGALIYLALYLLVKFLLPRLLGRKSWARNREFPVLLAIVISLGSAWAAHEAGLSPAFGAFVAGLLLSTCPVAVQVRADIAPLKNLLVTLFFAAIGMLVDPVWIMENQLLTFSMAALVMFIKPLVVLAVLVFLRYGKGVGLATGLCHGQVGEFSFVIAGIAVATGLIEQEMFKLIISTSVITLFFGPYLVKAAPAVSRWTEGIGRGLDSARKEYGREGGTVTCGGPQAKRILIIGFGPAGQRAAERLYDRHKDDLLVLEMNPRNTRIAESYGLDYIIGDARLREVLEHAKVGQTQAVIITLPDLDACRTIIYMCKILCPETRIFARARYHVFQWDLLTAGAEAVVSEEDQVGMRLADELLAALHGEELPDESD